MDRSRMPLTDRDALLEAFAAAPKDFDWALARIPVGKRQDSWRGGWSAQTIACHLADAEAIALYRFRLAAAEPGTPIRGYDEAALAAVWPYDAVAAEQAATVFRSLRAYNTVLLNALPDAAWSGTVVHDQLGPCTLQRTVEIYVEHAIEHIHDLNAIADGLRP